jgi:hypothetical protein
MTRRKQPMPTVDLSQTTELMQGVASALDDCLNAGAKRPEDKKVAFIVLLANFGEVSGGRVNYVSNANRDDALAILKELVKRWENEEVIHEQPVH